MNSHSANPSLAAGLAQSVPDGAAMFPAESHRRALDLVAGAILERVPFIAMTGNKGVGKTTVLEAAIARLAEQPVRFIRVGNPLATPLTLGRMLIQIANSGHGDPDENDEKRALIALRARQGSEEQVVLVVEEADTLRPQALSFLQLLTRISEPDSPLLQMLFVGRPSFWGLLEPAEFRELRERITVRAAVEPFSPEEAKSYIAYRLEREESRGLARFERSRDRGCGSGRRRHPVADQRASRSRSPARGCSRDGIRQGGPRPDWSGETIDHGPGGCPRRGKRREGRACHVSGRGRGAPA